MGGEVSEVKSLYTSAWCRKMRDGRTLILAIADQKQPILPDGVNDAVVGIDLLIGDIRDETPFGIGKTYLDILETGWKPVARPQHISLAAAISMIG